MVTIGIICLVVVMLVVLLINSMTQSISRDIDYNNRILKLWINKQDKIGVYETKCEYLKIRLLDRFKYVSIVKNDTFTIYLTVDGRVKIIGGVKDTIINGIEGCKGVYIDYEGKPIMLMKNGSLHTIALNKNSDKLIAERLTNYSNRFAKYITKADIKLFGVVLKNKFHKYKSA